MQFLGSSAKVRKATITCIMSVRPHEKKSTPS